MSQRETESLSRWIAHLDMDAFYASVELLRYPDLRGKPLVIGGRRVHTPDRFADGAIHYTRLREYAGRGVVTTATYEARALGVHSGMGLMKAATLAPEAFLLPADFDEYRKYSRMFKAAVRAIAPQIEDRGIDEIYVDLSELASAPEAGDPDSQANVRDVALRIKSAVHKATGLTCSIGLSPNKLLSKLCSELDKPNGLTIVTLAELPRRIWPLPANRINGIGPKASEKLATLGINNIGELAAMDEAWLMQQFGPNYGAWLHRVAHGDDERPIVTHSEPKSISRETTFERDLHPRHDRDELSRIFTRLCEQLAGDLARKGYVAKTAGIKLRFDDFKIVTRVSSADHWMQSATDLRGCAGHALKKAPLEKRLRLLGVRAENLRAVDSLTVIGQHSEAVEHDQLTLGLFEAAD